MNPTPRKRCALLVMQIVAVLATWHGWSQASGQVVYLNSRYHRYNYWYWWGVTDPLAQQIHAQADFQRALGESAIDFAEARKINADTFRKEIDNSVAAVEAYWDRKAIYRAEQFKRYIAPLEREQLRKSKQWDWLEKDPNFARSRFKTARR